MSARVSSRNQKKPKVDYNFDPIGDEDVAKKTRKRKSNIKANKNDTDVSSPAVKKGRGRPKKAVSKDDSGSGDENAAEEPPAKISKKGRGRPKKTVSDNDNDVGNGKVTKKPGRGRGRPKKVTGKVVEDVVEPAGEEKDSSNSVEEKDSESPSTVEV